MYKVPTYLMLGTVCNCKPLSDRAGPICCIDRTVLEYSSTDKLDNHAPVHIYDIHIHGKKINTSSFETNRISGCRLLTGRFNRELSQA